MELLIHLAPDPLHQQALPYPFLDPKDAEGGPWGHMVGSWMSLPIGMAAGGSGSYGIPEWTWGALVVKCLHWDDAYMQPRA